jgi:AcrR family transcriptional regulator
MKNSAALITRDIHGEIIGAAERLFNDVGFKKTTVADIAHELRMSPAKIYRFFTSKAEINAAVCGRLFGEIEANRRGNCKIFWTGQQDSAQFDRIRREPKLTPFSKRSEVARIISNGL